MGLKDFGFRVYEGGRTSVFSRMLHLATLEVARFFRSKKFLLFFLFCILPALMQLVMVFIEFVVFEGTGKIQGMEIGGGMTRPVVHAGPFKAGISNFTFYFGAMLDTGPMLVWLYTAVVGAGSLARDRAENALEIYFTRGIRPIHYFLAKWGAVTFMILCQLLFPFLLVWLSAVFLAPDWTLLELTAGYVPRLIYGQLFIALTLALWTTSLSSSTSSPRFAAVRWLGVFFVLHIVGRFFYQKAFNDSHAMLVSPWNIVKEAGFWIVDEPTRYQIQEIYLFPVWFLLCVLALLWARHSLQPGRVVA